MISNKSFRRKINSRTKDTISSCTQSMVKCSYGESESDPHRNVKCIIARWAWKNSIKFCTEAVFHGGGRADLILLDLGTAIEILHSEKLSKFKNKNYPIQTIPVHTSMHESDIVAMLVELDNTNGSCADYYIEKFTKEKVK